MSRGLETEIRLMMRNYETATGKPPRFLIVSPDEHSRIRAMCREGYSLYYRGEDSEQYCGMEIAVVRGKSKITVAG